MPTSSTSQKRSALPKSSFWTPASLSQAKNKETPEETMRVKVKKHPRPIRHISGPTALGSTSAALLRSVSLASNQQQANQPTESDSKQPVDLASSAAFQSISSSSSSFSEMPGSKTHLHQAHANHKHQPQPSPLSIKRQVNLKYVKTVMIGLLALDLMITVFVHHFSTQDQFSIALFHSSFKLRFSLINLLLTAIWFILLIGAIMFDVYPILLISSFVDVASLCLLLVFSINHFTRRIDYNTVQLTSLLGLLFAVVMLHVYLLVVASLMIYLTMAVGRRRASNQQRT